jgi:hypothetical protein
MKTSLARDVRLGFVAKRNVLEKALEIFLWERLLLASRLGGASRDQSYRTAQLIAAVKPLPQTTNFLT